VSHDLNIIQYELKINIVYWISCWISECLSIGACCLSIFLNQEVTEAYIETERNRMILFILDFTGGNMDIQSEELFSQVNPQSTLGKIIQFPITRIFSVCIFFVPVLILSNLLAIHVIEHSPEPFNTILNYPRDILTFFGVLFAYRLYGRVVEQRKTFEIKD